MKETNQITLGELIEKLESVIDLEGEKGGNKSVQFDFEFAIPTTLDSYRGYYNQLALGFDFVGYQPWSNNNGKELPTVNILLEELKAAVDKTFEGWKGGDYTMRSSTSLWVANPGNTGQTAIVGIDNSYYVFILTERKDT